MFERIQKMKKSRAIVFDFPFSFRYIFASFCSRTFWNTALESLRKDESKDIKTFKNRTPTKRAAWVRINQRYTESGSGYRQNFYLYVMYAVVTGTYNIFLFSDDWRRSRCHRGPWHSSVQSILSV